jgi:hypothetical protein
MYVDISVEYLGRDELVIMCGGIAAQEKALSLISDPRTIQFIYAG